MKNTPEKVASQELRKVKREWFPWQHTLITSHTIGTVDPILVEPLTAFTTVKLDMVTALQTNPTATPLFSSAKVTDSVFFVPQRILGRGLQTDNFMETGTIEQVEMPLYTTGGDSTRNSVDRSSVVDVILPGSLMHRLGLAPCSVCGAPDRLDRAGMNEPRTYREQWNMSPLVAYYMICERYYTSPYAPYVAIPHAQIAGDKANGIGEDDIALIYQQVNMYALRDWILTLQGVTYSNSASTIPSMNSMFTSSPQGDPYYVHRPSIANNGVQLFQFMDELLYTPDTTVAQKYEHLRSIKNNGSIAGLWPASYDADYQTLFFDSDDIDELESVSIVGSDGNSIQGLRIQKANFAYKFKNILRGRKFSDWVDIHFGCELPMQNNPIFCGSNTMTIVFDDVLNQSGAGVQGSAVARGKALGGGMKEISFTALEPGYLLVLRTIVPEVAYKYPRPHWLDYKTLASFPTYELSGTAFQSLTYGDFENTYLDDIDNTVVGEQPLYFDYMRKSNRLGGVMSTEPYESYSFQRTFDDGVYPGYPYIKPSNFDYQFPEIAEGRGMQNFFFKTKFNMRVLQPLKRTVLDNIQ